jgi:hypothetical protein
MPGTSEATNNPTRTIEDCPLSGEPTADDEEANATAQPTSSLSEEERTIDEIVAHGFETWLNLAHWAKVNDVLEARERSLTYSVGDRIRRGIRPSFAQARWAKTILADATDFGFGMLASDGDKG